MKRHVCLPQSKGYFEVSNHNTIPAGLNFVKQIKTEQDMKKILSITSSINGEQSFSLKLSQAVIAQLQLVYPQSTVQTRDLTKSALPHLQPVHFEAFRTSSELRTEQQQQAVKPSDGAIKEVMDADIIVIGVPFYNFTIPDTLKSWIDHIVRSEITFKYEGGFEGLVKGKKVYLAIASGGIYSEGEMKSMDFTEPYLRTALGFIGLTDISVFRIEGLFVPEFKDTAVDKAMKAVGDFIF